MRRLGYINEGGYLTTKEVEPIYEKYTDSTGVVRIREITEDQQAAKLLDNGYKPVDDLDETKLSCEPGYYVRIHPVDSGARISFTYETVKDIQYYNKAIDALKRELEAGDYKITKSYEAMMVGEPAPYDVQQLHAERQALRDRINSLEAERDSD